MITFGILFILAGLLLIFLEFFLPGGIMAIFGILSLIGGVVLMALIVSGLWVVGLLSIVAVMIFILCKLALRLVRGSQSKGSYFLQDDQKDSRIEAYDMNFVGKKACAATDLKPSGHIEVGGQRFQAVSLTGYLPQGTDLSIVRVEGAKFFVQRG